MNDAMAQRCTQISLSKANHIDCGNQINEDNEIGNLWIEILSESTAPVFSIINWTFP